MGKHKTQRTEALQQAGKRIIIAGEVQNRIEQHNFDSLVRNGVIIEAQAEESMLNSKGGGVGEGRGSVGYKYSLIPEILELTDFKI